MSRMSVMGADDIPTSIIMQARIFPQELESATVMDYASRMTKSVLALNIHRLRTFLGDKQTAFAERVDTAQGNISKWENGTTVPEGINMATLAELAGVPAKDFRDKPWMPQVVPTPPAVIDNDRAVDIIKLDMSLSMGDGTNIEDYVEETNWQFDIDFIRSFTRTPPHRIRIATGVGDSMFPTILASDAIFFDTTQTRLNLQDKIWACSIRGGGAIKRLRIADAGKIIVLSDNASVPDDVVDADDVRIFGRVLRLMRDL